MKLFAVMICLIGSLMLYCSHSHQRLLNKKLSKNFVYLGLAMLLISIIVLLMSVPKLVALYMWFMTMIVVWSLVPFIHLFKNMSNEISNSTKNSA